MTLGRTLLWTRPISLRHLPRSCEGRHYRHLSADGISLGHRPPPSLDATFRARFPPPARVDSKPKNKDSSPIHGPCKMSEEGPLLLCTRHAERPAASCIAQCFGMLWRIPPSVSVILAPSACITKAAKLSWKDVAIPGALGGVDKKPTAVCRNSQGADILSPAFRRQTVRRDYFWSQTSEIYGYCE